MDLNKINVIETEISLIFITVQMSAVQIKTVFIKKFVL